MHENQDHGNMETRGQTLGTEAQDSSRDARAGHEMSREQRLEMLHTHHLKTLWVYWTLLLLGLWTMLAPITFGYGDAAKWVDPSGGRGAWFSTDTHTALRASLMTWSDVIAGALLTFAISGLRQPGRG